MITPTIQQSTWFTAQRWAARLRTAHWLWFPLFVFVATRLGIMLVAYVSLPLVIDAQGVPLSPAQSKILLHEVFTNRYDAIFYVNIARDGHQHTGESTIPDSLAFFPLLPLLMRALASLTGDVATAGLIITNSALLLASIVLYRLVAAEWSNAVAERTVWYLLIFPTSFYGSVVYSESLFLLCAVTSLLCARRGWWVGAAIAGALTGSTRLVGVVVAPMLLIEWWVQRRRKDSNRPPLAALLAACAVPLGIAAYMFYLDRAFGDPLAFARASAAWGRTPKSPVEFLQLIAITAPLDWWTAVLYGAVPLHNWIDALCIIGFIMLGCVLLRWRRWSEATFVLLGALIPLNSGMLASQRRYVWVLFPAFIVLACWGEHPWIDRLITILFLLGLGLFTAMFANWYWVA